jgi:tetratricopeptide (TPR) repeat protein
MKKINILILLAVITFTSCDNYLDIKPKGQIILKDVSEYNGIFNDDWFLLDNYYANTPVGTTDEFWPYNEQWFIDNPNTVAAANFFWDESVDRVTLTLSDMFYDKAYERISRFNIIIHEVLDAEGSDEDKREAWAKAKVLRAFNHFLLVNYYAKQYDPKTAETDNGIVVIKKFDMEQEPVQSTVQDAYDFILQDIEEALPYLRDKTENSLHPSSAFGYALLAKVYLFMGEYDKALEAADESLAINDYVTDLVEAHENSTPGWYTPNLPGSYDSPDYLYYGGGGWGMPLSTTLSGSLISKYDPDDTGKSGDIRLDDFYVSPYWIPGATFRLYMQYGDYKHIGAGLGVPEVLLMKAECLARKGDAQEAMRIVNDLRRLRILPENYTEHTASDAKEAVKTVIDERARELVNTLNRFYDIRRLANDPDYAVNLSKEFNGQTYTTTGKSHIFIMPFPKNVTDKNSSVKQNTK